MGGKLPMICSAETDHYRALTLLFNIFNSCVDQVARTALVDWVNSPRTSCSARCRASFFRGLVKIDLVLERCAGFREGDKLISGTGPFAFGFLHGLLITLLETVAASLL